MVQCECKFQVHHSVGDHREIETVQIQGLIMIVAGVLFNELVTGVLLLHNSSSATIMQSSTVAKLENMIDVLDKFNQLAPGSRRDDAQDLSWPGVFGRRRCATLTNHYASRCVASHRALN